MPVSLFIKQLDDLLAENGLAFVSTVLDIVITFALAWLIVALVQRAARSLVSRRVSGLEEMKAQGLAPASTTLPLPPASPVVVPKNYVMPVPNEQILLMNNLKQNDGY